MQSETKKKGTCFYSMRFFFFFFEAIDIPHSSGVLEQGGGVPGEYDRLIEGSPPYSFRVMSAIPQSRQVNFDRLISGRRSTASLI